MDKLCLSSHYYVGCWVQPSTGAASDINSLFYPPMLHTPRKRALKFSLY